MESDFALLVEVGTSDMAANKATTALKGAQKLEGCNR